MHFEEKDFKKVIIKQETVCQSKMKRDVSEIEGGKNEDHFVKRGFKRIALRLRRETGTPRGWVLGPPMIEILWPGPAPLRRHGRAAGALRAAVCCLQRGLGGNVGRRQPVPRDSIGSAFYTSPNIWLHTIQNSLGKNHSQVLRGLLTRNPAACLIPISEQFECLVPFQGRSMCSDLVLSTKALLPLSKHDSRAGQRGSGICLNCNPSGDQLLVCRGSAGW